MPILREFYYSVTQSSVNYSRTPTGSLAIKELIEGNPCWIAPTLPRIEKQKTLLLADWTISAWSLEKRMLVKRSLGELIDDGFSIYIWRDGQITPMDKYNLSQLDDKKTIEGMTLASTQEITKAAITQNKLTLDQVQVIDDYWLNQILTGKEESEPRVLRISEIPDLNPEKADLLFNVLSSSTPKLVSIILDEFSQRSIAKVTMLTSRFSNVEVKCEYRFAELTNDETNSYTDKIIKGNFSLDEQQLRTIKDIKLNGIVSTDNLQTILKTPTNLKAISLDYCNQLASTLALDIASSQHLESIEASNSDISLESLQVFLKTAPNLKTIKLNSCKKLAGTLELDIASLQHLESIEVFNSNLSLESLQVILKAAPNLKTINLSDCGQLEGTLALDIASLQHLESIDVSNSNISLDNLQVFLKTAPNLKTIKLNSCKQLAGTLALDIASLQHLESIDLSNSNISPESLQVILKAAPNLKTINLHYCNQLEGTLALDIASLQHLESIDLSNSNISLDNLHVFLKTAPNLKKINLNGCEQLAGTLALDIASLQHLESIEVFNSNLSPESLQVILKAAPNLKTIKLNSCKQLAGTLALDIASLQHLESIDLSYSNISLDNLQVILKAAPNLKTINLSDCGQLEGTLALDIASLQHLESIEVPYSNLSLESLQVILKAAPNLKIINLNGCEQLAGTLALDIASLQHLESIEVFNSNLSLESLQVILKAAPNLKTINLSDCGQLEGTLALDTDSLQQLESINLADSNISLESLHVILKAAPNLKTINLSDCGQLAGTLTLDIASLQHLESMDVSFSNLSLESLQVILKAAPSLKTINLRYCDQLAGTLVLDTDSLQQLESINLADSNISPESLQVILKAAPNLKTINLNGCKQLAGTLALDIGSLQHLESIDVSKSNISLESLQVILKAAPNLNPSCKRDITHLIRMLSKNHSQTTNLSTDSRLRPALSSDEAPSNPIHSPNKMKNIRPTPANEPFQFKAINKTRNQGMIIEKLCQYLTHQEKHLDIIPKIQDGICVALSHYFSMLERTEWDEFVDMTLAWDGQDNLDKKLINHFDNLHQAIQTYQFATQPKTQYIGDELASFLNTNTACILSNPWHAIAIRPTNEGRWLVYDPNFVTGYQEIAREELLKTLHTAIGTIVAVEADQSTHEFKIKNPDAFIAHGGLLALCQSDNAEAMLASLPADQIYSKEAIDGLNLRSTSGKPAWAIGLASKHASIRAYTQQLLVQFESSYQQDAAKHLASSLGALTAVQKSESITKLVQLSQTQTGENIEQYNTLIASIRTSANKERYEQALKTWDKTATATPNALAYCHACVSSEQKKRLIELDSTQQVDTLRLQLEQHATNMGRPVFYIDKPDDLICSAPWMKKNADNTGTLCNGPGGPLHDFLQANKDKNPLLIVNYERFNADDIVRFNGLLDKDPNADGTVLPTNTMVLGLMNRNKADCYQGSDFYSRFNRTERCPLTKKQLDDLQSTRTVEIIARENTTKVSTIINLYHAPDWEERLLGRWELNGDALTFKEGELIAAIEAGKQIEIQNGSWGDERFERFWQHALTGGIRHAGRTIRIPPDMNIVRPKAEAYAWDNIPIIKNGLSNTPARVLNPTCMGDFLGRYELEGDKLIKKPGWIELVKNNHHAQLMVNVTRTLTDDAWAMLLNECKHHGVTLVVHCAPGVTCPVAFKQSVTEPVSKHGIPDNLTGDVMISSTDIDTTVFMLTKGIDECTVIDVSECTPADLLVKLDGKLNKASLRFEFSQSDSALTTTLAENKNIILKGRFSSELIDSLAPVLQAREQTHAGGRLVLVTDDEKAGAFVSNRYAHVVSKEDKLACLPVDQNTTDRLGVYLEIEPLSKLRARCHYLKSNPKAGNSDDAWLGMDSLPERTQAETTTLDKTLSAVESTVFTTARISKVNAVLGSSPYVFLTGLSGVGKSTFVEQELCKNDALYLTESHIQSWAEDKTDKRKILFLDEANLSPRQWSEFEGLFTTPPGLLINGKFYPLTKNHKVIFAGNPVNYGDERTLAPFFQNHGNAVLFTPLPPAMIYEKILKPVFSNSDMDWDPIADRILDVYRFVCECSTTDILISPRELQMMALLTLVRAKKHPDQDINAIAQHFSYELAKNLVPPTKRSAFDAKFRVQKPIPLLLSNAETEPLFLITPSRQGLSQQLHDLLELRQWRRESKVTLTTQQKAGGLGGIIIEGEPGIGKSELVISELVACGYQEEHNFNDKTIKENPFYRMPVSMPLSEKEDLLIKAFNEGAVVIIDEINSSPMMERLLNDLLMGKNPKGKPEDNVKPGFMVIGTQNPVSMAGRRVASSALQRRLITTVLPEYKPDEIKTILLGKGIASIEADSMIEAYEKNRTKAIKNNWSPVPNFRNLIELADNHTKQRKRSEQKSVEGELDVLNVKLNKLLKQLETMENQLRKISNPKTNFNNHAKATPLDLFFNVLSETQVTISDQIKSTNMLAKPDNIPNPSNDINQHIINTNRILLDTTTKIKESLETALTKTPDNIDAKDQIKYILNRFISFCNQRLGYSFKPFKYSTIHQRSLTMKTELNQLKKDFTSEKVEEDIPIANEGTDLAPKKSTHN